MTKSQHKKILKERKIPRPELLDKKPNHQEKTLAVLETVGPGAKNICGALFGKFLLTEIILQVVFRQNSNTTKFYPVSFYLKWIG